VALLLPPLPVLAEEPPPGVDPGPARAAWQAWAQPPDAGTPATAGVLRALAGHLGQALAPLTQELRSLSAQATAQYSEREGAWTPIAAAVCSWCAQAEAAQDGMDPVASIKAAETGAHRARRNRVTSPSILRRVA
jgi:hypothetical protein